MGNISPHGEFRRARDLLLSCSEDPEQARRVFEWPRLDKFNWALDWFDVVGAGNTRTALRLVTDSGNEDLTYQQLACRSGTVADWLSTKGLRQGDVVLLVVDNTAATWELMLALIKLRAVIVPTFTTVTHSELLSRISRSGADHLICDVNVASRLESPTDIVTKIVVGGEHPGWLNYDDSARHVGDFVPSGPTDGGEPLFYYFTSGTTARPKLVVHTHVSYAVGHLTSMFWNNLRPGDLHLNVSAPGWAKFPWSSFFGPWNAEATVVSMDTRAGTPERLTTTITDGCITSFCAPPSTWRAMLRRGLPAERGMLREALSVGEPLGTDIISGVAEAWGLQVRNGYGQSEVTAIAGVTSGSPADPLSLGYPLPGYEVVLCDVSSEERVLEGELCIELGNHPIGMMRGYLDDPPDVAPGRGRGVYRTGDMARWNQDGTLRYLGRRKDMVVGASGNAAFPVELEHALYAHPAVVEAVVVALTTPGGDPEWKAFVAPAPCWATDIGTAEIIVEQLRHRMSVPETKWYVEFLDDLPRTESGKVRREALRQLPRSPATEVGPL